MDERQFLHFGYFITKPIKKPDCIGIESEILLTASNCFCNLAPDFWHLILENKEQKTNAEWEKLTEKQFANFKNQAQKIFEKGKLVFDEFFAEYDDALTIQTYFPDCGVFSLGIAKENSDKLYEEMANISSAYTIKFDKPKSDGIFCGYDILGWEGGFHTYLCNGLEEKIREKYILKINEYGLIANNYDEVVEFAKLIADEGEPVLWLPYAVYKHN